MIDDVKQDDVVKTEWANQPSLSALKEDVNGASADHEEHEANVRRWLDYRNITNQAMVNTPKGKSKVQPKTIRKQAEWRYAALTEPFLSTYDIFKAAPVSFEDGPLANQDELVINTQFNTEISKVAFIDEYVRTAVDEGTVIAKVGWNYIEASEPKQEQVYTYSNVTDPEYAQLISQAIEVYQNNPAELTNLPRTLAASVEGSIERGELVLAQPNGTIEVPNVLANHPIVEVCDYRNLIIDPTSKGVLADAQFIVHRFISSLAELRKDGKYSNLESINVTNGSALALPDDEGTSSFTFKDEPRKKLDVYEYWGYWDIHDDGRVSPIVVTWVGDTIIRMEESPFPFDGLPFDLVQLLPVRKENYGEPDAELIIDNQKIIGAVTRGMVDVMGRSANGQMGRAKNALDVVNKRKFEQGKDYEYNPDSDPSRAFYMHTFPEIPASASVMLGYQNSDAESLTGVKAFSSGGLSGDALGPTATGVRGVLDAASKRELGILRRLGEGLQSIARKFIAMNAVFLSEDEVVRITNAPYIKPREDGLNGKYDLRLTISTAEADDAKAAELSFMLQTTAQSMGQGFTQLILTEIARLRKMPELAKSIKEYAPEPDPVAQQIQQLEIQKLQMEIAKLESETIENRANAQLDVAKAQTEQSKSRDLSSTADLKNLDFVEQESGTKQERELEKAGQQAKAQTAMKVVEHALKFQENSLDTPSSESIGSEDTTERK